MFVFAGGFSAPVWKHVGCTAYGIGQAHQACYIGARLRASKHMSTTIPSVRYSIFKLRICGHHPSSSVGFCSFPPFWRKIRQWVRMTASQAAFRPWTLNAWTGLRMGTGSTTSDSGVRVEAKKRSQQRLDPEPCTPDLGVVPWTLKVVSLGLGDPFWRSLRSYMGHTWSKPSETLGVQP